MKKMKNFYEFPVKFARFFVNFTQKSENERKLNFMKCFQNVFSNKKVPIEWAFFIVWIIRILLFQEVSM